MGGYEFLGKRGICEFGRKGEVQYKLDFSIEISIIMVDTIILCIICDSYFEYVEDEN